MLWTIAYKQTSAGAVTDADTPLIADQTMPVDSGNHPLFPVPMQDVWFWGGGATLSRIRQNAPKFRGVIRPMIRPLELAANPSSRPIIQEAWRMPVRYRVTEPIAYLFSNGAAETDWLLATFGDGNRNSPQGDEYTARWTSTFTMTINAWTAAPNIVFDDTLPQATFAVIGMDSFFAGSIGLRIIPLGQLPAGALPQARPGIVVPTANGSESTRYFRHGYLGEFTRFLNTALPTVEALATAATTNPEGYFDLIMVTPPVG